MPAALLAPHLIQVKLPPMVLPEQTGSGLCDQGGRLLGPRAQNTRVRILDATVVLLGEMPMRDLRVIDIARRIGSSSATFYQYFKDVEDVVLHLARHISEYTPEFVELVHGDWTGRAGHERGRKLAEVVICHWDRCAPILRVRNNACDEGDIAFRELRMSAMLPLVRAFAEIIAMSHRGAGESAPEASCEAADDSWQGGQLHPMMAAVALVSVLERLSMYHVSVEELAGTREELIETLATLLQSVLISRR